MPMRTDVYVDSCGAGKLRVSRWTPETPVRAVMQLVHGIAEHVMRYDAFARFLNTHGILVVAEDHMGHGASVGESGKKGYFYGGWFAAVEDTYRLLCTTQAEFSDVPFILFGHSMGSFMVRTMLQCWPEAPIAGCIISGTGWQPNTMLTAGKTLCRAVCAVSDETQPSEMLHKLIFGSYNARIEHPRTASDWLSRDAKRVDAYESDPMCGFMASAGLLRDMLTGISFIQKRENLQQMPKQLPVLFVAGGDDPVGAYGKGAQQTVDMFRAVGMEHVTSKIYPLCRHELLNELNRDDVFADILAWTEKIIL